MKILSNVVGDSNDEDTFSHKLLLTNTQVPNFGKAFANNSSANVKLSKIQLNKIAQDFLGRILGPWLNCGLPLIGNVLKPLAKVLISSGLTAAAIDAAIYKKIFGSVNTTLIEMNDIMKIVISLKDSGLLIKGVSETTKNEAKELIGGVLGMLLGILSASLLRILLTG